MERREAFSVDGLANGVARLVDGFDENPRRASHNKHRKQGFYAPDVVFEGGMARCPWEVGMHIPSGSSGSDHNADNQHIRIPSDLVPQKEPAVENTNVQFKTSSTSFGPSTRTSPTRIVVEDPLPPPTPAKDVCIAPLHI